MPAFSSIGTPLTFEISNMLTNDEKKVETKNANLGEQKECEGRREPAKPIHPKKLRRAANADTTPKNQLSAVVWMPAELPKS